MFKLVYEVNVMALTPLPPNVIMTLIYGLEVPPNTPTPVPITE